MSDDHYNHGRVHGQIPYGLSPGSQAHMDAMRGVREYEERQRRLKQDQQLSASWASNTAGSQKGLGWSQEASIRQQKRRAAVYPASFDEGQRAGYEEGWSAAIERRSEEVIRQMAFTREHIADKDTMAQQLAEQRMLIDDLRTRIDEMKHENSKLKKSNAAFLQAVSPVRLHNERLRANVGQSDGRYKTFGKTYDGHVWRHQRSMAFTETACFKSDALVIVGNDPALDVTKICSRKYGEAISSALAKGAIKMAPQKG